MIELGRHLEVLLLSNDCVTVPDFGGFVAHYVPAHIDEADGMFLPPMRTIGFNPQLKINDSLLAQSYVEAYDISYPEALRIIEQEIDEIKRQVQHEGVCQLNGIGSLYSNGEGSYNFEPQESGLLTPSLYGLSSYEFDMLRPANQIKTIARPIQEKEAAEEEIVEHHEEGVRPLIELLDEDDDNEHAIHVKMSWIRNSIAIAVAIALFFCLTSPIANSDLESQTMSTLQNSFLNKLMPKDSNMSDIPAVTVKAETTPTATVKPKTEVKTDTLQQITPKEPKPYCLVLASQVKQSNAEEYVRILHSKGFKDTEIYIHNNVVRVVYGHFESESDAYVELHNLRFKEHFKEAWVYKRKAEG